MPSSRCKARGAISNSMQAEHDAYIEGWNADIGQKLTDATRKLSDASEQLKKAKLHRDLEELRADRDAVVQSIAKVSVGSVLQSGQSFITLVPANAQLEIEANVSGREDGYVHVGDPVSIKFDTFPYAQFGMAQGTVRLVSPDSFTVQDETRNPTGSVPLAPNSEPFYRAHITVTRTGLHGVPPGFRIIPGMPVTADVKVGKRTVLELSPRARASLRARGNARAVSVEAGRSGASAVADRFLSYISPPAAFRRAILLGEQGEAAKAFPLLARAAKAGIADAQFQLGRCYLEGRGTPPSRIEGVRWLERAADQGHGDAQWQLASLCVYGLAGGSRDTGTTETLFRKDETSAPDFVSARDWARKAADGGSAQGQALLGYVLTNGPDSIRDLDEAHRRYGQSAKAGCAEGCLGYAISLSRGDSNEEERREIARNLRHASDSGLATATYLLAALVEQGIGAERDEAAAMQLYRRAAESGNPRGANPLRHSASRRTKRREEHSRRRILAPARSACGRCGRRRHARRHQGQERAT